MDRLVAIASHRLGLLLETFKEILIGQHISFLDLTFRIIRQNQTNSIHPTFLRQETIRTVFWL
jgi:hypothetical protein